MSKIGKPRRKTHEDVRLSERVLERIGVRALITEKIAVLDNAVLFGRITSDTAEQAENILTALGGDVEQGLHRMDLIEGKAK